MFRELLKHFNCLLLKNYRRNKNKVILFQRLRLSDEDGDNLGNELPEGAEWSEKPSGDRICGGCLNVDVEDGIVAWMVAYDWDFGWRDEIWWPELDSLDVLCVLTSAPVLSVGQWPQCYFSPDHICSVCSPMRCLVTFVLTLRSTNSLKLNTLAMFVSDPCTLLDGKDFLPICPF